MPEEDTNGMCCPAEANLAALFESTTDMIWSVDQQGRLQAFNQAFRKACLLTFHLEPTLSQAFHTQFPPERAARWQAFYERALHEGPFHIEYTMLAGTIVEFFFHPIISEGEVTGVSIFGKDITQRKIAEEVQRHLSEVIESSEDAIFTCTTGRSIFTWNRGAAEIFGYTREEAIGMPMENLLVAARPRHWVKDLLGGQAIPLLQLIGLHKNGQRLRLSATGWPTRNPAGEITGISLVARDESSRIEAENAKALLASIVESSDDAIYSVSLDGAIVSWNAGAERLCGYKSEEILHKPVKALAGDHLSAEKEQEIVAAITSGRGLSPFDTVFVHKDGTSVDVSVSISPVRDAQGKVIGASGIARNITQKKQLLQALTEAEKKYRTIFDDSLEGIFQSVLTGQVITANRAAARMLGYSSPQELISMVQDVKTDIWFDQEERLGYLRNVRAPEHGVVRGYECRFKRKDGSVIWVALHGRLVRDDRGRPLYHEGLIQDITERIMATQAMKESEARFRSLFENSTMTLLLIEPDNGTIVDANRAAANYYGYPLKNLIGAPITLLNTLTPEQVYEERRRAVLEERTYFNFRHRLAAGELRDVRVYSSPVHIGGKILLYSIVFDVTEQVRAERALRENAELLEESQRIGGIGSYVFDVAANHWSSSTMLDEIFGIDASYPRTGQSWLELVHPDDRERMKDYLSPKTLVCDLSFDKEFRIVRKNDGTERWVLSRGKIACDAQGKPERLCETIKDITERKISELALRASEARYRTVFQASLDCIAIGRMSDGVLIDVNHAYLELLGFTADEVLGKTDEGLNVWLDPTEREKMTTAFSEDHFFRDTRARLRRKDGTLIWVLISASLIEVEGTPCVLTILRDVSDAKAAEDKIWNLAFYDSLTQLPNRRLLLDRLRQMLASGMRSNHMHALLFIDLDNFKSLNDTHGHQNGDSLLSEVARRLTNCVRASDTVARLGGDEFIVLLDYLDQDHEVAARQTETIAHKILTAIEKPFDINGREYFPSSSIGIALFDGVRENASELLQQADIAMYQAKAAGRNTLRFFAPALQAAVQARAAMEEEIRAAIRTHQFYFEFQPQVDGNGLIGAEALIRWCHPERGLMLPGTFIPIAEESGLIVPLGTWILEAACQQIRTWSTTQPAFHFPMAVNISARQFRQPNFVERLFEILDRTEADPTLLKLELTESMLIDSIGETADRMHEIKKRGVQFSLDDFGTGYSSLSYLKRLPFDQLKIDRAFVHDLLDDLGSRAIAQAIISLGHALGLNVVAEGVENCDQRDLLLELGCSTFQGHFFGRPQPLEEFERRWRNPAHPQKTRAARLHHG
jgi:diguanylate cyclase (GGDEF)-like protein/PAS domain S-box-containing protein